MENRVLTVAVGAALAAGVAPSSLGADIRLSGRVGVELVNVDSGGSRLEQGDRNGHSRWVMNFSEDLGDGLQAFGRMGFQLSNVVGGNGEETNRDSFAGLRGAFGAVSIGRQAGCYKSTGGTKWDPFTATFMQARRSGGMTGGSFGHNARRNDIVQYRSPKGSAVKFCAQAVVDEQNGQDGEYHLSASWRRGPLELIAAANRNPAGDEEDRHNLKVGGRFRSGGLTGFVQFEEVDHGGSIRANGTRVDTDPTDAGDQTPLGAGRFVLVGLSYRFGSNRIAGQIGGFDSDASTISDVDYFALGFERFFSRKTRIYGGYSRIDVRDVTDMDMVGLGVRFDFG